MGKKKNKRDLPTVQKMNEMGFQDGYSAKKSKENDLLTRFCKKGVNKEQIKIRISAYCLGYKKGQLIMKYGVNSAKDVNGQIAVNGQIVKLDDKKNNTIEDKIKESVKFRKMKKRR